MWSLVLISLLIGPLPSPGQILKVGDVAPDFALKELDGTTYSLADFRGHIVLISFFGYD